MRKWLGLAIICWLLGPTTVWAQTKPQPSLSQASYLLRQFQSRRSASASRRQESYLLVKFKERTSKGQVVPYSSAFRIGVGEDRYQEVWRVEPTNLRQIMEQLADHQAVRYALPEAVTYVYPLALKDKLDDKYLEFQWSLPQISLEEALNLLAGRNLTFAPVTIIIVDTGIWADHEDLAGLVTERIYCSRSGCQPETSDLIFDPHGTHVAGIAAALTNNQKGVASLNLQNKFRLVSIRVFDALGEASGIPSALEYILENYRQKKNVVVNYSLGSCFDNPNWTQAEKQQLEEFLAWQREMFDKMWQAGILSVSSAGNTGSEPDNKACFGVNNKSYPAAFNSVISVAALAPEGSKSPFSQYGDWVDLAAPGGDQERCLEMTGLTEEDVNYWENNCDQGRVESDRCNQIKEKLTRYLDCALVRGILSTIAPTSMNNYARNDYYSFQGTSQAAPLVAGLASLIWSLDPSLTNAQVRQILFDSAEAIPQTGNYWRYGRINAYQALQRVLATTTGTPPNSGTTATPTPTSTPSPTPTSAPAAGTKAPTATSKPTATAIPSPTPTPAFLGQCRSFCSRPTFVRGDANCDGQVDQRDYWIWLDQFDKSVYQWAELNQLADFDCNGQVDLSDFELWRRYGL